MLNKATLVCDSKVPPLENFDSISIYLLFKRQLKNNIGVCVRECVHVTACMHVIIDVCEPLPKGHAKKLTPYWKFQNYFRISF